MYAKVGLHSTGQELYAQFLVLKGNGVQEHDILKQQHSLELDDNAGCIKVMYTYQRRKDVVQALSIQSAPAAWLIYFNTATAIHNRTYLNHYVIVIIVIIVKYIVMYKLWLAHRRNVFVFLEVYSVSVSNCNSPPPFKDTCGTGESFDVAAHDKHIQQLFSEDGYLTEHAGKACTLRFLEYHGCTMWA